ncbi:MAG: glycosyltransferase family 9 protein [Nautiliaceae bacterium]
MKILVFHSWGMGDMIMATPMLKSLAISGYKVDLVTTSEINRKILKGNNFLENIYVIDKMWKMMRFFGKYDYLAATAGINPKKIKFLGKFIGVKKVFCGEQQKDIHRIEMNLKIVEPLLKKIDKEPYIYINNNQEVLKKYLKPTKNIGFAVGSGSRQKFKRWPYFKELIQKIDGNKLIFIGPDEIELEEKFKDLGVIVKENIEDTINLISNLDLLIGNDNGLMHIGYATKINTVTIYGMTNEKETGGYRENNESVFLDLECRPCFDPATDYVGCDDFKCLKDLKVEEVYKRCQKFL